MEGQVSRLEREPEGRSRREEGPAVRKEKKGCERRGFEVETKAETLKKGLRKSCWLAAR